MPYTEFHYTPMGTGVISGKEVLEQTEDAINDLGGQISGDVQTAIDTANNALNTANTASADAQNAVNTANTAYTAATNAQNTANTAQTTASNALTAAQNAQNDVNALGNRVTTAENNITQNTSDISGLTTRMGTAEGNITNLQNDVITAQGTATSAQNTATLARGQAYVVRYASVAVSDNSTVPYTDLNNTDNIKANDLLLDINGKLYQISSVDTSNETVSVTTPLTQLAVDSSVMHLSGNETAAGDKTFSDNLGTPMFTATGKYLTDEGSTNRRTVLKLLAGTRDTDGYSCSYITRLRSNKAQGALISSDVQTLGFDFVENQVRTINTFIIRATNWLNDIPQKIEFTSNISDYTYGSSTNKAKVNDLNPGALSLPDLDSAIDISGYITNFGASTVNEYTPSADGWISIANSGDSPIFIRVYNDYGFEQIAYSEKNELGGTTGGSYARYGSIMIPCIKNIKIYIIVNPSTSVLVSAKFYPCQGNV